MSSEGRYEIPGLFLPTDDGIESASGGCASSDVSDVSVVQTADFDKLNKVSTLDYTPHAQY